MPCQACWPTKRTPGPSAPAKSLSYLQNIYQKPANNPSLLCLPPFPPTGRGKGSQETFLQTQQEPGEINDVHERQRLTRPPLTDIQWSVTPHVSLTATVNINESISARDTREITNLASANDEM